MLVVWLNDSKDIVYCQNLLKNKFPNNFNNYSLLAVQIYLEPLIVDSTEQKHCITPVLHDNAMTPLCKHVYNYKVVHCKQLFL